jgi:flagellar biosynthesis protein FlhA
LLSRDDLQLLLDKLHDAAPAVVEEFKADTLRTAVVHQVLLLLLEERVPITDLGAILEAVLNHSSRTKEPEELAECARRALARSICDRFRDDDEKVRVVVLEPRLEHRLQELLRDGQLLLQPAQLERLIGACHQPWQQSQQEGHDLALLTDGALRRPLRRTLWRALPDLGVLSYGEVPRDVLIDPRTMIRAEDLWPPETGRRDDGQRGVAEAASELSAAAAAGS